MKSREEIEAKIAALRCQWARDADYMEKTKDPEQRELLERETIALSRMWRELEWVMS